MNAALPKVSIEEVRRYLQAKNWVCSGSIPLAATVWHRVDSEDAEVVLPLSRSVKDHDQRLRDAVESIANFERREPIDVANDVAGTALELVAVRVSSEDTLDGRIPINDGILLIQKAKDLLYSAAMALYAKRKHFGGRLPKETKEYLDTLLLGQTEVGSYVVKVIAPLNDVFVDPGESNEKSSFTQEVAHSLTSGLSALTEAARRYQSSGDLSVFARAVGHGASANMCDALLGFSGSDRSRSFEVKVSGPAGPLFARETKVFPFKARDIETLKTASGFFKGDYVLRGWEVVGSVKHLRRPHTEEIGTITVDTIIGEGERSVNITLGPEAYQLAVRAHERKLTVRCWGDLHVKSRSATLMNPNGFQLVDAQTLL